FHSQPPVLAEMFVLSAFRSVTTCPVTPSSRETPATPGGRVAWSMMIRAAPRKATNRTLALRFRTTYERPERLNGGAAPAVCGLDGHAHDEFGFPLRVARSHQRACGAARRDRDAGRG